MNEAAAAVRARAVALPAWAWLTAIVVVSALARMMLARRIVAPWIMVDELIYSELGKSIASHGSFMVRGVPTHSFGFLYPLLIAPAFRIGSVTSAYAVAKGIDSVVMSLAAVPAYFLARRVVRPQLALVAGALTVLVPSMVYTGELMTENLFYPLFLTCALALVLVLERPAPVRIFALLALSLAAFLTRAQAVALVPAILTAPLLLGRVRLREFRLLYGLLLGGCAVLLLGEAVRGHSPKALLGAYQATANIDYTFWTALRWLVYHVGELDLYVGVAPFAALVLLLATRERKTPFVAAAAMLSGWLVLEVAVFASAPGISRIEERNMFFVAPLFFIALCRWIELGAPRPPRAAAVVAVAVAALPGVVPYSGLINGNATSDTLALLPLWELQDTITTLDQVGTVVVAICIALALAWLLVPLRYAIALPTAIAVLYLVSLWPIESNPHGGIHHVSLGALFGGTSIPDREWIDHAVGRRASVTALYDSRTMDKFTVWTNEFFNRSIDHFAYVADQTPGGLAQTQATIAEDGFIHGLGDTHYVLTALPLIGRPVIRDKVKGLTLWRLHGRARIAYRTTGIYGDGWTGARASIDRFACEGHTLLRLRQGSLFTRPQIVDVNGVAHTVDRRAAIQVPACRVEISVPVTRVPGPSDPRELGIIVDGFS